MRQPLTFACEGATLAATLHPPPGCTGVVIVSGGVQTRHGSHRGFVALADALAAAGHPVLRFDRRGVGDSDGQDPGFRAMTPDIAAAIAALRAACPTVERVVGWGLCDGASALAMDPTGFVGLILANPWTRDDEATDTLPPPAAIAARYASRLADPRQWLRLLTGGVSLPGLLQGLRGLTPRPAPSTTVTAMQAGLARFAGPVLILLAERDATAQAFAAQPGFPQTRAIIPDATHTFPGPAAEQAMIAACLDWLAALDNSEERGADYAP